MDRDLTGAVVAALAGTSVNVVHLLELDLSPTVYLTDAGVSIVWNGHTYLPSYLLSFSDVEEESDAARREVTIGLSGVDQSIIAILLQYEYLNREARVRKAVLSDDLTVIADPSLLVSGRLDRPTVATDPESGTCNCSIDIVGRFVPLGRPAGRYTNSASQQTFFAGDLGFDNVATDEQTLIWGAKGFVPASVTRGLVGVRRWAAGG